MGHWGDRPGPGRLTGAELLCPQALHDASILIFANKQDMKDSMTTVEISQFLTLSAIKDHPWHIQGCCALTGEGLVAAPPGPPGPGQTREQLTIRTFSCLSCQNPAHSWSRQWSTSPRLRCCGEAVSRRVPAPKGLFRWGEARQPTETQIFGCR